MTLNVVKFLHNTIINIVVKSTDNLEHKLTIKFTLPYVDDKLIYNDNSDKSKGYILKDGSYSKKLRVGSLKKLTIIEEKCYQINTTTKNALNTTQLPLNEFGCTSN